MFEKSKIIKLWLPVLLCAVMAVSSLPLGGFTALAEATGNSGQSESTTSTANTQLATPVLSSVSNAATGAKISWKKVSGAEGYRVFYRIGNDIWHKAGDTTDTSFVWTKAKSGKKYSFTVRCISADGSTYKSGYDPTGKSLDYIAAPKVSLATNASSIQIKWDKVAGASSYRVFYKNASGTWKKVADTTSTSYTYKGIKNGQKYTFTVRCLGKDGKTYISSYDPEGQTVKIVSAPKLSSVSTVANGIKISWGKVSGAEKYRVFYKTGSGGWKKIADTTSTSYTWTGATGGKKYTFTVRCINKEGKSYASTYDSKGKSLSYVAAPKISSVSTAATGVEIKWNKPSGAVKFRVFYKANGESTWHKAGDTTSTSYTWKNAKSGTNYAFTIRCITSDAKAYTSGYDTTGKSIKYIAAPKISSVSAADAGIKISWGSVSGAEKYRVFYKTGSGGWTKIADTASTSYTWTGAKNGTKYTFTVRCINSAATAYTSSYDSTGKSITSIAAPKLLYAVNIATGTLITWEKSAGAAKYRVFYKANGESTWHKAGDTTSTQYTWKGAKSGTKYTFTVRCISSDGSSYTSSYDTKGVAQGTTFTTSKGYQGVVKNGVVYIDGYLIANKTYPLPESYGNGITSATQAAFNKMRDAAAKDGMNLYISSGFRSYSTQKRIYNNYVARDGVKEADTYSARPGYSEHQSGLALDLNTIGNAFNGTPQAIWLEKNCYKYGFILRYPKGKTNETGYVYESWHFRYVGEELAKKLYNGGNWLTMEDYFGFNSQYN